MLDTFPHRFKGNDSIPPASGCAVGQISQDRVDFIYPPHHIKAVTVYQFHAYILPHWGQVFPAPKRRGGSIYPMSDEAEHRKISKHIMERITQLHDDGQ